MNESGADYLAGLEETLLQVSMNKRLIVSPSGSLLVVYSRRDLVRMHKAKSRAILKAEKEWKAERLERNAQNE